MSRDARPQTQSESARGLHGATDGCASDSACERRTPGRREHLAFAGRATDDGVFRQVGTCASSDGCWRHPMSLRNTKWRFETSEYRQGSETCPAGRMGDGIDLEAISTSSILTSGSILGTAASSALV